MKTFVALLLFVVAILVNPAYAGVIFQKSGFEDQNLFSEGGFQLSEFGLLDKTAETLTFTATMGHYGGLTVHELQDLRQDVIDYVYDQTGEVATSISALDLFSQLAAATGNTLGAPNPLDFYQIALTEGQQQKIEDWTLVPQAGNLLETGHVNIIDPSDTDYAQVWQLIGGVYTLSTDTMLLNMYNSADQEELYTDMAWAFVVKTEVPEPESLALFGFALIGFAVSRRKKFAL